MPARFHYTGAGQVQKIIQRRRSAEAWREIVSRQERSGVSVQAFCEREGISAASLYAYSGDVDRPFRPKVTGHSAGSAL
jgi:hypothetical protein